MQSNSILLYTFAAPLLSSPLHTRDGGPGLAERCLRHWRRCTICLACNQDPHQPHYPLMTSKQVSGTQVGNTTKEEAYPVRVFRKSSEGWQRMKGANSKGQYVRIVASPSKGSILLEQIKVRISLSYVSEAGTRSCPVNRRRRMLLISVSEPSKILGLLFRAEKDCLAFTDRLMVLNPSLVASQPRSEDPSSPASTADSSEIVNSYVARLLNEPEFIQFVNGLESTLAATEDGEKMLQALASTAFKDSK